MDNIKGFALAVLLAQKAIYKDTAPVKKIRPVGFLDYLLRQSNPRVISATMDDGSGYIRNVNVRYKKRATTGESVTVDDCSFQGTSPYFTQTIPALSFRKKKLWFDWNTIELFTQDALATEAKGTPPTMLMREVIESITAALNGLLGDVNGDLLTTQAANFGKNIAAGNNAARTVNFPLNTTTNPLASGMGQVMDEAMQNEIMIMNAAIVGAGLINNYYLQQKAVMDGNQSGVETNQLAMPQMYYDPYTTSKWGSNQFGVFEQDAVQFLNICKFRGPKTKRWGVSEFGTIKFPIADSLGGSSNVSALEFDFQAQERDCPSTLDVGETDYIGNPIGAEAIGRGLGYDLMIHYGSVSVPSDAYKTADPMNLVNGTLRYAATNV